MSTRSGPGGGRPGPGLDAIISEWRQLINLACRLLGGLIPAWRPQVQYPVRPVPVAVDDIPLEDATDQRSLEHGRLGGKAIGSNN